MGKALYRKYRSKSLDEIVGQSHITDILQRSIKSGKIAHAYLLTGPRGVGKTSIARILAHEINNLPYDEETNHLDIVEIDAASNNSVEDVRDLREKVQIAPVSANKKIYIIDEVHMLSKQAFNALLKTLEEPPEHVVFILATTDVEKLPATIISRVQRFNFRSIAPSDAVAHMRSIATTENIDIEDEALELIAVHGKGSFRDSISLLDQLQNISDGKITRRLIENVLGLAEADTVDQLITAYDAHDLPTIVKLVDESEKRGTPAIVLAEQLIRTIREQILEKPHLLSLLDSLLEITRSAWPHIKLLTALTSNSTHASPSVPTPAVAPRPAPQKPAAAPKTKPAQVAKPTKAVAPAKHTPASMPQKAPTPPESVVITNSVAFPWQDFLGQIKEPSIGTFTLLGSCGHDFDGSKLVIYGGRKFNKNKLDKAVPLLSEALQKMGYDSAEIIILDTPKPPEDSQTAAIVAMMGGGEEVSI